MRTTVVVFFVRVFLASERFPVSDFFSLLQLVLCRVAAVNVSLNTASSGYIFWTFRIIEFILSYFKTRVVLKALFCIKGVRGGRVVSATHLNTGHKLTQLNRALCFLCLFFFVVFFSFFFFFWLL